MPEDKSIYTESKYRIPYLERDYRNYLDRTTLIYGKTGSGKTWVIRDILDMLKDKIPVVYLIAPRTTYDKDYKDIIPEQCLIEDLTKSQMQKIWKRQTDLTELWNMAQNMSIIQSLFTRCNDVDACSRMRMNATAAESIISQIRRDQKLSFEEKTRMTKDIQTQHAEDVRQLFKNTIKKHKDYLKNLPDLTDSERNVLMYMWMNPRILILTDDSTEHFKKWETYFKKSETNIFESIAFKGRHNFITSIIVTHDDTYITPPRRKNAHVSIFTSPEILLTMTTRQNSGFTAKEKKLVAEIANRLFSDEKERVKLHMKLCIIDCIDKYQYMIAGNYRDTKMGSEAYRKILSMLPQKQKTISDNPYLHKSKNKRPFR